MEKEHCLKVGKEVNVGRKCWTVCAWKNQYCLDLIKKQNLLDIAKNVLFVSVKAELFVSEKAELFVSEKSELFVSEKA